MTSAVQQPDREPDHDWLDVADAVGVTPTSLHAGAHDRVSHLPHPAHRDEFTDDALNALLVQWATDAMPVPYLVVECTACSDTGLVTNTSWVTGLPATSPCRACDPIDERGE